MREINDNLEHPNNQELLSKNPVLLNKIKMNLIQKPYNNLNLTPHPLKYLKRKVINLYLTAIPLKKKNSKFMFRIY